MLIKEEINHHSIINLLYKIWKEGFICFLFLWPETQVKNKKIQLDFITIIISTYLTKTINEWKSFSNY